MRVALVTDKFVTGGGLEHIYQLCAGMPDVTFGVFGRDGVARDKFAGLGNVTTFISNDTRAIRRFFPDVVHYHHLKPLISWSRLKTRTLFTVHGVHLHKYEFKRGIAAKLARFARLSLERVLYRRVDTVISVSAEDAAFLRQHYGLHSVTIFNGIAFAPIQQITEPQAALRECLGFPLDKKVFLTVARFDFPKGYDVLVRAIAAAKRHGPLDDRLFVFAGDGADLEATVALASALGVQDNIRFLGRRTDVYELMLASDTFVLPSRWEGMPITLIEALVARRPAVASATYGISTVKDVVGKNVHLFPNENAEQLARLLAGEFTYEDCDLGMFTLERMVAATRKVYSLED